MSAGNLNVTYRNPLEGMVRRYEKFDLVERLSIAAHPTVVGRVRRCEKFDLV